MRALVSRARLTTSFVCNHTELGGEPVRVENVIGFWPLGTLDAYIESVAIKRYHLGADDKLNR